MLRTQVFDTRHGDRDDVHNIGILITDGESTKEENNVVHEASLLKQVLEWPVVGGCYQWRECTLSSQQRFIYRTYMHHVSLPGWCPHVRTGHHE